MPVVPKSSLSLWRFLALIVSDEENGAMSLTEIDRKPAFRIVPRGCDFAHLIADQRPSAMSWVGRVSLSECGCLSELRCRRKY